jgi:predicted permease
VFELLGIFLNVLVPVFVLVVIGYAIGPRLKLEARTLSRISYFIFIPAYVFDVLSAANINVTVAAQISAYAILAHVLCAGLGFVVAKLLKRPPQVVAAYVLIAVFGNVGNFGIPIVKFRFPDQPYVNEVNIVYFLAIVTISFIVGVAAANWNKGGVFKSVVAVLKTPALMAVPPALLTNFVIHQYGLTLPLPLARPIGLLAAAMIPTMVVALGVQLASAGLPKVNADMVLSTLVRLMGGPILALLLAAPFGLSGIERSVGIIQSAMPAAVLASIIAFENDLLPEFVIGAVLFSTLASVVTLTVVLALF